MKMCNNIYDECVRLGIEIDHHYSDLYIPVTIQTATLVSQFRAGATTFLNNVDHRLWYDIPFQYQPYWKQRAA